MAQSRKSSKLSRAASLLHKGKFKNARPLLRDFLQRNPNNSEALELLGVVYFKMGYDGRAIEYLSKAAVIEPKGASIKYNLGLAFMADGQLEQAKSHLLNSVEIEPGNSYVYPCLSLVYKKLGSLVEAIRYWETAIEHGHSINARELSDLIKMKLQICDWQNFPGLRAEAIKRVREGGLPTRALGFLYLTDDPELVLANNRLYAQELYRDLHFPQHGSEETKAEKSNGDKIRIVYLSSDFGDHAVAFQIVELIEHHDREKFEVIGVSIMPDDGSAIRKRLVAAFDQFIDIGRRKDIKKDAQKVKALQADILVDLNGYTSFNGLGLLKARLAPLQVHYLGFPGTLGCEFVDYLISDPFVVPPEMQHFYIEPLAYLPNSFFPSDSKRFGAMDIPTRGQCGLPEKGFVFACFNHTRKITPEIFGVWMQILNETSDSILWLSSDDDAAKSNLRNEAEKRKIDPQRLVFAGRVDEIADHYARHSHIDLFLDTVPYNAHSTSSDALWNGVPVLTCPGRSFQSRVAGSLLRSAGLSELVVNSLSEYERMAVELAKQPEKLQQIRDKLEANRKSEPMFDTKRLCRNLEKALATMWDSHKAGNKPQTFYT